jgi:hypothetical protein
MTTIYYPIFTMLGMKLTRNLPVISNLCKSNWVIQIYIFKTQVNQIIGYYLYYMRILPQ